MVPQFDDANQEQRRIDADISLGSAYEGAVDVIGHHVLEGILPELEALLHYLLLFLCLLRDAYIEFDVVYVAVALLLDIGRPMQAVLHTAGGGLCGLHHADPVVGIADGLTGGRGIRVELVEDGQSCGIHAGAGDALTSGELCEKEREGVLGAPDLSRRNAADRAYCHHNLLARPRARSHSVTDRSQSIV